MHRITKQEFSLSDEQGRKTPESFDSLNKYRNSHTTADRGEEQLKNAPKQKTNEINKKKHFQFIYINNNQFVFFR